MSKLTHEGVEIGLDAEGKFIANLNGMLISRSSLEAVKKAISEGNKAAFEPFNALYRCNSSVGKPIKKQEN